MPKPTRAALGKHPKAVVLLARLAADHTKVDYDFEWFETDEGVRIFFEDAVPYAEEDVKDNGDLEHALVELTDATVFPPTLGRIEIRGKDDAVNAAWSAAITATPASVVAPTATRTPAKPRTAGAKVKPKVKPKQPSAAAAVLHADEAEGNTAMTAKAAKSADLKARLAAKRAAEQGDKVDEPEAEAPVPKAKPTPKDAHNALQRRLIHA